MPCGFALVVALATGVATATPTGAAQRLYVLSCGEGVAGDVSRWSPGVNEGKPMPFVGTCYLIRHERGWMLWDTGVPDAVASMPGGLKPSDPRATHWYRRVTLASQLERLGVKPGDVRFIGLSHTHPDHVGNVDLFPETPVLIQRAEYEWAFRQPKTPFRAEHPVTKLDGDRDVFGDGSVVILSTPGHTPGHQSLLVHLRKTGWIVLSGDAVHFRSNWEARRVPAINTDREQTLASMQRLADVLSERHAQLWINHDAAQAERLRHAPDAYE
jgi:glyoxylase-like metal-dependent hydrolase (beta-lactamase superfamily II)